MISTFMQLMLRAVKRADRRWLEPQRDPVERLFIYALLMTAAIAHFPYGEVVSSTDRGSEYIPMPPAVS